MQPIMLYGGADPTDAILTSFLAADASPVDGIVSVGKGSYAGIELDAISLPGHSMNQMGFMIDDVFFCADVVFPEATLEKYPIPYLYGLTEHFSALESSKLVVASKVVPGHGPILDSIEPLVQRNLEAIQTVIDTIRRIVDRPMMADEICRDLFNAMELTMTDAQAYYLLRPTVQAYLAHLEREGLLQIELQNGSVVWLPGA
ncbi:MAG: hypothetical protein DI630_32685 [Gordonia sp. (in: high G+C Gram-positive bacteria)]|nr:MAG: hypothetical protein DI630_32685 [Gordonia sp. (in: high G+C Gram-positive bacteria)]